MQPIPQGFSVVVVPLKFVGAREMARLLEPFAADNTVRVDEMRNLVIIAGHQREMRHLLDTIELFDVDLARRLLGGPLPDQERRREGAGRRPRQDLRRRRAQSPLAGIVRVIPIERLNALLRRHHAAALPRDWRAPGSSASTTLGGTSGGSRFFVYHVSNGKAENLAQLIGDLFSARAHHDARPRSPRARGPRRSAAAVGRPAAGTTTTTTHRLRAGGGHLPACRAARGTTASEVRVIADKDTNSLLILATPPTTR